MTANARVAHSKRVSQRLTHVLWEIVPATITLPPYHPTGKRNTVLVGAPKTAKPIFETLNMARVWVKRRVRAIYYALALVQYQVVNTH